ncbi:MAG TPA: TonB-dependent receptor [Terriglobales bacterium]|nr:TonB-dependent receptor [Terriglobales bacterium]
MDSARNISFIRRVRMLHRRYCFRALVAGLVVLTAGGAEGYAQNASRQVAGEVSGIVRSGNMAVPGATVTATEADTSTRASTTSNPDGSYTLPLAAGDYSLEVEMTAFATASREVVINKTVPRVRADFDLVLQSRIHQMPSGGRFAGMGRAGGQGDAAMQAMLSANGEEGGNAQGDQVVPQGMPVPGMAPNAATESVAVSGNTVNSQFAGLSTAEMEQRMREWREQRADANGYRQGLSAPGGPGGPGGPSAPGGPGGAPRGGGGGGGPMMIFGGRGHFNINRPHGTLFYDLGDAVLDASPYSLTGAPVAKPGYVQHKFGGGLGGPLNIPKIYNGGDKTFFFISYNGLRSTDPYDAFSTVPTLAERNGNFSSTLVRSGPKARSPVTIINPLTGLPFVGGIIPQSQINPAARGLLQFIPAPNLPGTVDNFHYLTSNTDNENNLNVHLVHSFGGGTIGRWRHGGKRNNLNGGFHYHNSDTGLANPYPTVGGNTSVRGFDVPIGYVRSLGKITNIARMDYNRETISTRNLYAYLRNITGNLGIAGVSQNPFDWGLPNISLTNFGPINDTNPLLQRDQTWSFSDFMIWRQGRHTVRWGGDFRRIQLNTETDNNARGSFTFTGVNTAEMISSKALPGTGYDFADFLLGLPQLTAVQYGSNNYHFRGNSWDIFLQDDWRLRGNLTVNFGLRYEYFSPFLETNNQIANLDLAPNLLACAGLQIACVTRVLPGQSGLFNGEFPATLVRPDRNNFAPRLGIAWKALSNTVVRAGYGINYNTSAYSDLAQQLAFQPPFSLSSTNIASPLLPLTLQNGFPAPPPQTITNTYAVDPNYRLGYVQIWNLDVQQELTPTILVNVDYTGTKGTRLDIVEAPNRTATGLLLPGVQPFLWETSAGDSVAHAASLRVRKRLQGGISVGGTYTFSKSIDNASSLGSGATIVAQNAFDLAAERGLSSFDQRHRFTADYLWELPFGADKRFLVQRGVMRDLFGNWQWSGDWSIESGMPFTARVLGSFTDVNRGTNGTLRADLTGQSSSLANPTVGEWFNTAAFVAPPAGQYGNAGRNTIIGPSTILFDMAMTKVIPMGEARILEVRGQATNVFNTPQFTVIDTTVNSPSFGRVTAAGNMRQMQLTLRYRF